MAGFSLVEAPMRTRWYPVDYNDTLYVGQIVSWNITTAPSQGLTPYVVGGAAGATYDMVPLGVVIGFNNRTPLYVSTYSSEYAAAVSTTTAQQARESVMVEGQMWAKDPALMAQVALIDSHTLLKGRLYHEAWGTAPSVLTNTAASSDGSTITTATLHHTPIAYNATWYCRSGANMGLYRMSYSAHATSNTFYLTWPYGLAANDTFVYCAYTLGTSYGYFDTSATYVQANGDASTYAAYIYLDVEEINLREAGNEYIIFRINPTQFVGGAK